MGNASEKTTARYDSEDDIYACGKLCLPFLEPLPTEIKNETVVFIHEINKASPEDIVKEKCSETIIKIEKAIGPKDIVCDLVTKVIAERLRKLNMLEDAVEIINCRMERLRGDDFGCLIILARMYDLSGNYRKAGDPLKCAHRLAEKSGNPLLLSVVLVKQACNMWHMKDFEQAKQKLDLCLSNLDDCDEVQKHDTSTDSTHWLIDVYKTLGYINRTFRVASASIEYYIKALEVVEKDKEAYVQMFKIETQIGCAYSASRLNCETQKYCLRAYERIKELSVNQTYVIHHPLTVIHALSRIAYSLEMVQKDQKALEIRELSCSLSEKYLDENHPEVGRLAADTAYLCNRLSETAKENLYIEKCKACLEFCADITDIDFLKLYVRELSDAWYFLGRLFINRDDFEESEKCMKNAITVNTRVYGCNHIRLSKLYKSLGYLYKKFNKFPEAANSFKKCKEINEEFNQQDTELIAKLEGLIKHMGKLGRRTYPRQ